MHLSFWVLGVREADFLGGCLRVGDGRGSVGSVQDFLRDKALFQTFTKSASFFKSRKNRMPWIAPDRFLWRPREHRSTTNILMAFCPPAAPSICCQTSVSLLKIYLFFKFREPNIYSVSEIVLTNLKGLKFQNLLKAKTGRSAVMASFVQQSVLFTFLWALPGRTGELSLDCITAGLDCHTGKYSRRLFHYFDSRTQYRHQFQLLS